MDNAVTLEPYPKHDEVVFTGYKNDDSGRVAYLAENILSTYMMHTMTGERGPIWYFDGRIWRENGEQLIRGIVARTMVSCESPFSAKDANDTVAYLKATTWNPDVVMGGTVAHRLVLENGTYDLNTDEFHEDAYFWDDYQTSALPIRYDPETSCPNIEAAIARCVPAMNDSMAIYEFLGGCLMKDYRFKDVIIFEGDGDNGKSTVLEILTRFLGEDNVMSATLQELQKTFMVARLHGKLANICPDIPDTPIKETGLLKMLTGQDQITARNLYKSYFTFFNHAKLWFSTNKVPASYDNTKAFYGRMRIIEFHEVFKKGDPDTMDRAELIKQTTTPGELSGLLNVVLEAGKRYREQKELTGTVPVEEATLIYDKKSDLLKYFVKRFISHDPEDELGRELTDIYKPYCQACAIENQDPRAKRIFSERLAALAPYIEGFLLSPSNRKGYKYLKFALQRFNEEFVKRNTE